MCEEFVPEPPEPEPPVPEFWEVVARERRVVGKKAEVPDIISWLEKEIVVAREAAFKQFARRREGAEYWTGYADALETLLRKIQRREVRV